MTNYIALAIPLFFVLIGVELVIARRRKRQVYRFTDAISDLGCGVTQQVVGFPLMVALLGVYVWLFDHHRFAELSSKSLWAWGIAFLGVDFFYYWWHRASHRVNVLWAVHAVHHQSEDYNLAVALRQPLLTEYTALPFFLPLALCGIPPIVFATVHSFSTLYQFWIHTEFIERPGPLGRLLNLPSHHRVHHAINARYLDKNYGATLIVWDRLFGTFEDETERPVYGVTQPLGSFNPLWAQLEPFVALARMSWGAQRFADKLHAWWKPPDWKPHGTPVPPPPALDRAKYDVTPSRRVIAWVAVQFALIVVGTFFLLLLGARLSPLGLGAVVVLLVAATALSSAMLEGRRWAWPGELACLLGAAGVLVAHFV
jgi:alkylglycerol monooxygenase